MIDTVYIELTSNIDSLKAIPVFDDRGIYHYSKCPCGGTIASIRTIYNGHLRASCDKCNFRIIS